MLIKVMYLFLPFWKHQLYIVVIVFQYCLTQNVPTINFPDSNAKELMNYGKSILSTTWNWLTEVMNSIENQLKIGEEFDTQVSDMARRNFDL